MQLEAAAVEAVVDGPAVVLVVEAFDREVRIEPIATADAPAGVPVAGAAEILDTDVHIAAADFAAAFGEGGRGEGGEYEAAGENVLLQLIPWTWMARQSAGADPSLPCRCGFVQAIGAQRPRSVAGLRYAEFGRSMHGCATARSRRLRRSPQATAASTSTSR